MQRKKRPRISVSSVVTSNPWDRVLPKTEVVVDSSSASSSAVVPYIPVLNRLFKGAVATDYFISHSVSEGTAATYSTGVRRWMQFAPMIGTDFFMSVVPKELQLMQSVPGTVCYTWPETCVMN